ncbi:MAG: nitroreductase family deazaflavin-dependent oxidoreductase [Deltaproteobacteria bacterium]|nr:nitroreductase family deazaflavin-dependent oxidoreductase [Deltaproteobacteria bacterium]
MSVDSSASRFNRFATVVLRSPLHWPLSFGLMLITFTGRRTGRSYTIPVGYQRHGDILTILASEAQKKQWWRNFHEAAQVEVRVKGKTLQGAAHLVPPSAPEFTARAEETLRRLPWMGKVFGVKYRRGEPLDDEQVATLRRNIAVVQVTLAKP